MKKKISIENLQNILKYFLKLFEMLPIFAYTLFEINNCAGSKHTDCK